MKNFFKTHIAPIFGIIALVVVIGLSMAACDDDSDDNGGLYGIWVGYAMGRTVTVTITDTGWTLAAPPDYADSGTYIMVDGITARLITAYSIEVGTAVLLDSNTISVTLNSNSIAPGTHILHRQ
jgi:hypothetical protein